MTTDDSWLNKLMGNGSFIRQNENPALTYKGSKKGVGRKDANEKISKAVKETWDKKKEYKKKSISKQANCPFRDANNQMFPIAWVIVRVENNQNWFWFPTLLREDLNLGDGGGIIIISYGQILIEVVADWIPNVEHRQCTRHIYANFKKKMRQDTRVVSARGGEEIKQLDEKAYEWQWLVYASSFIEVKVRRGDQSFGVNLHTMKCVWDMWQLSGIPCVHVMVGYMHIKMNPDLGIDECMPPPTHTPFISNTMPPPTFNEPSGSYTMPPPATPSSKPRAGSQASASRKKPKGKCPLVPKKEANLPPKRVVLSA
ncbi:zinc finger, PMZ-type containing protein [Tanacetum coccineum]